MTEKAAKSLVLPASFDVTVTYFDERKNYRLFQLGFQEDMTSRYPSGVRSSHAMHLGTRRQCQHDNGNRRLSGDALRSLLLQLTD